LTGGPVDLPARQQTLRATIAWSHALLTEAEQTLFRRLGVFSGDFSLEAAEAITAGEADGAAIEGLAALVDKSLVRRAASLSGEPRATMLETIHAFALEQLRAAGEEPALRAAHAAFFLTLAEAAALALVGPEQARWLDRLETEHDNLQAALAWLLNQPGDGALRLAGALGPFWDMRGYVSAGRAWLERALASNGDTSAVRAKAARAAGDLAVELGDYAQATAHFEASLAGCRAHDDQIGIAAALSGLAKVADFQGDDARAIALFEEALVLQRRLGHVAGIRFTLNKLGIIAYDHGDYTHATALFEESLGLARMLGDQAGIAVGLNNLGLVVHDQGDDTRATALFEESLALERVLRRPEGIAITLHNLGTILYRQGDYTQAIARYEESLALERALGRRSGIAESLNCIGWAVHHQGDEARAEALFDEALALFRTLGEQDGIADVLSGLGVVAHVQGDLTRATALLQESLALFQTLGEQANIAVVLENLAAVAADQGRAEPAARWFGAAAALRDALGAPRPSHERAPYDGTVAKVRETLGEAAFAAAWTAGTTSPLADVLTAAAVPYT
jgi:tetratricopeptide (TPR) repeat protein